MSRKDHMPIFTVLRLVRDARSTRKSDRELLYALALRCNPAKQFIAWPSYACLALDTLLDEVTLQRAAKRLEDAGLIKRVVRHNQSNHFYINVALLQEQAAKVKADDAANEAARKVVADSPFEQPVMDDEAADRDPLPASPAEAAVLADLDSKPAQKDYKAKKKVEGTDELLALLYANFPDHPSLNLPTSEAIAKDCIHSCLATADGDVAAVRLTLMDTFAKETARTKISTKVKNLGGYISEVFPKWLATMHKKYDPFIPQLCDIGTIEFEPGSASFVTPMDRYFRSVIGAHLLDLTCSPDTRIMTAVITPAYKIANLLSRFTTTTVAPDRIPPAAADEETLNQCRSLSMDETWVAGLRDAGDPVDYMLGSLTAPEPDEASEEADDVIYDDEAVDDIEVRAEEFLTREPMMRRVEANY